MVDGNITPAEECLGFCPKTHWAGSPGAGRVPYPVTNSLRCTPSNQSVEAVRIKSADVLLARNCGQSLSPALFQVGNQNVQPAAMSEQTAGDVYVVYEMFERVRAKNDVIPPRQVIKTGHFELGDFSERTPGFLNRNFRNIRAEELQIGIACVKFWNRVAFGAADIQQSF